MDSPKGIKLAPKKNLSQGACVDLPWKVVIADDDEEVHAVTKLVLRGKRVLGRELELLSVKSAAACRELLSEDDSVAVILLDVVMETDDAGLRLVRWIREELGNHAIRIILRTGQPGQAPEERVISDYDINDYKEKTELTEVRLLSTLVTAIRGYRDIRTIAQSRNGMRMILSAAPELFSFQSLKPFASGVLTQLTSLVNAGRSAALLDMSGIAVSVDDQKLHILAGSGRFLNVDDTGVPDALGPEALSLIRKAAVSDGFITEGGMLAMGVRGRSDGGSVIFLSGCGPLSDLDTELVQLYCTNVLAAYDNLSLYRQLEQRLDEKIVLIQEIHHRVKNNLQILLSLINLSSDKAPHAALESLRRRIGAMASVYNQVSGSSTEDNIRFDECAAAIVGDIAGAEAGLDLRLRGICPDFRLSLNKAVPCALLTQELLSYAVICGYRDIELYLEAGPGLRRHLAIRASQEGDSGSCDDSGYGLSKAIAGQLKASMAMEEDKGCLVLSVEFQQDGTAS